LRRRKRIMRRRRRRKGISEIEEMRGISEIGGDRTVCEGDRRGSGEATSRRRRVSVVC